MALADRLGFAVWSIAAHSRRSMAGDKRMNGSESAVPIEDFVQALQAQLDRAQRAMHIKAKNLNLPLTFAVKDIAIDLRTHVEVVKNQVRVRPAGPGDHDASLLHLSLTTVTRPMIEENAFPMDANEERLDEVKEIPEEDRRKLEWAGRSEEHTSELQSLRH